MARNLKADDVELRVVSSVVGNRELRTLQENSSLFLSAAFPICLSRACLGKVMAAFQYRKWTESVHRFLILTFILAGIIAYASAETYSSGVLSSTRPAERKV